MTTPTVQPSTAAVAAREALESGDPFAVMRRYRRATNFLAAAQVYLKSNALLRDPLTSDDIKPRLLGHWGAAPAINLVYAHLDRLVNERQARVLLVTGSRSRRRGEPRQPLPRRVARGVLPGHDPRRGGRRAVRPLVLLAGRLPEPPDARHAGHDPRGRRARLRAGDVVRGGDGQPGPARRVHRRRRRGRDRADGRRRGTATSFLDPRTGGAVLPILDVNGYKISSATISGTMSDDELLDALRRLRLDARCSSRVTTTASTPRWPPRSTRPGS